MKQLTDKLNENLKIFNIFESDSFLHTQQYKIKDFFKSKKENYDGLSTIFGIYNHTLYHLATDTSKNLKGSLEYYQKNNRYASINWVEKPDMIDTSTFVELANNKYNGYITCLY